MVIQKDTSLLSQNLSDMLRHRIRLPGFYNASAASILKEKAPDEFDAEQIGIDAEGQSVYALFWHIPNLNIN